MAEFPVNAGDYLANVFAVALFGSLLTQWFKRYISVDLIVNLLTLSLCWTVSFVAALVLTQGRPSGMELFTSAMTGFFGATVAVFGFESIKNAYDLIGQLKELLKPKS